MVKKISGDDFQEVLESKKAVVDFSAGWCGPCKMLAPVIDAISSELDGQVNFFNIDVDEAPELAAQYSVMSIPAVILFKDGEAVSVAVGFRPQPELETWIRDTLL